MKNNFDIEYINDLTASYIDGTATPQMLSELREWASLSVANRRYVREHLETAFSVAVLSDETFFDEKQAYDRFLKRVDKSKVLCASSKKTKRIYRLMQIAAVMLLLILPTAAFFGGQTYLKRQLSGITLENVMGGFSKMNLPDGTSVWLNSKSKLTYEQGFGIDNRNLSLSGEAYFEVVHNKKLPFTIQSGDVRLKVLGTSFTFRNYEEDSLITVDLLEGCVKLATLRNRERMQLAPNERMVYDKQTGRMMKRPVNAALSAERVQGKLFFDEMTIEDIAQELGRCYSARIEVAESICGKRFYGSFDMTKKTLDDILETLSMTHHIDYKHEGGRYLLY